jgi:pimeloyl-ACP methyl ester carboxylesterase
MSTTTLVLLPGLDGTGIFFGPLLRHLPQWIEPRVVTYPEHGPNAYADLLPLVHRAMDSCEESVILGWSFGGPLALMAAATRRSRVRGLVFYSSFVSSPRPTLRPLGPALQPPLIATLRALRRARFLVPGYASHELRAAKARTWQQVNATALAARARAALAVDVRGLLASNTTRTLYIAASRDEVIPRRCAQEVLEIAPHADFAEVEGPHMALFTDPVSSAARIAAFLSGPGEAGSP